MDKTLFYLPKTSQPTCLNIFQVNILDILCISDTEIPTNIQEWENVSTKKVRWKSLSFGAKSVLSYFCLKPTKEPVIVAGTRRNDRRNLSS